MAERLSSSLHPLTPPLKEEERLSWLRLIRSRKVGVATFYRLLSEHGTAEAALAELPEIARSSGIDNYEVCSEVHALAEMKAGKSAKAQLLSGMAQPP